MEIKHIEINIWKACNNKCRFCMSSKPSLWDIKFVTLDILKKKIKLYYDKGYRSIWFLWWDISIHPDIENILEYCNVLWYIDIHAITNWMIFDNFDYARNIVNKGLTRINISVHSHLSSIEDYLTQVPGCLSRKKRAIDYFNLLVEKWLLKSNLSINIVLNKHNLNSIVETVLYFYKVKHVNDIRINFIWLSEDVRENWDDLKISYTDFLPYLKKLIYISLKNKIRLTFDTVPACIFYKIDKKYYRKIIKMFLWEDKDHIVEIDDINNNKVFDWAYVKEFEEKIKFKECTKCLYKQKCQWVWKEYSWLYWNSEFIPINHK